MIFDCWPAFTWEFIFNQYVRERAVGSPWLRTTVRVYPGDA
jgi:hypothetical protein